MPPALSRAVSFVTMQPLRRRCASGRAGARGCCITLQLVFVFLCTGIQPVPRYSVGYSFLAQGRVGCLLSKWYRARHSGRRDMIAIHDAWC